MTGSILGLASILAFAIAAAGFQNDTTAVFSPIFGSEPEPVAKASDNREVADIAGPLEYMAREFPEHKVTFFIVHEPGTTGQHSDVIAAHSDRLIFGEYYGFTAAGEYEGNGGISDGTTGQQITGAIYNVHFGNWGGLPVKFAYLTFGLGLCVIIASGLSIYFVKREAAGRAAPRLAGAWQGIIWGTPALLAVTLTLSLVGLDGAALVAAFWTGLLICLIASGYSGADRSRRVCQASTAIALAITASFYVARYGAQVLSDAGLPMTIIVTLAAVIFGLMALRFEKESQRSEDDIDGIGFQPAE